MLKCLIRSIRWLNRVDQNGRQHTSVSMGATFTGSGLGCRPSNVKSIKLNIVGQDICSLESAFPDKSYVARKKIEYDNELSCIIHSSTRVELYNGVTVVHAVINSTENNVNRI
jgi:hypothetical protein